MCNQLLAGWGYIICPPTNHWFNHKFGMMNPIEIESVKTAWRFFHGIFSGASKLDPKSQVRASWSWTWRWLIVDVRTVESGFVGGECGEWGLGAYNPGKSTAETWKSPVLKRETSWTKPLRIQVCLRMHGLVVTHRWFDGLWGSQTTILSEKSREGLYMIPEQVHPEVHFVRKRCAVGTLL